MTILFQQGADILFKEKYSDACRLAIDVGNLDMTMWISEHEKLENLSDPHYVCCIFKCIHKGWLSVFGEIT